MSIFLSLAKIIILYTNITIGPIIFNNAIKTCLFDKKSTFDFAYYGNVLLFTTFNLKVLIPYSFRINL